MEEAPSLYAFKNPNALFAPQRVFCYRGYKKNCRAGSNQHLSLNYFKPSFICIWTCVNKPSISKAGSSVKQGLRVGESLFQKELNTMFDYTDYQPYLYICKIPLSLSRGRVDHRVRLAPFLSSSQAKVLHQR